MAIPSDVVDAEVLSTPVYNCIAQEDVASVGAIEWGPLRVGSMIAVNSGEIPALAVYMVSLPSVVESIRGLGEVTS